MSFASWFSGYDRFEVGHASGQYGDGCGVGPCGASGGWDNGLSMGDFGGGGGDFGGGGGGGDSGGGAGG